MTKPLNNCLHCERPMVSQVRWMKAGPAMRKLWLNIGLIRAACRGLCNTCDMRARKAGGDHELPPRVTVPRETAVEEWDHLKTMGAPLSVNLQRVAPRLGMTPKALDKALRRAGRIGEAA